VAVVEGVAAEKGTLEVAKAYLEYLYSPEAQAIASAHFFRPRDTELLTKHRDLFPAIRMKTIADFGGWEAVQQKHFSDGGLLISSIILRLRHRPNLKAILGAIQLAIKMDSPIIAAQIRGMTRILLPFAARNDRSEACPVVELVDALDSKSCIRKGVSVRVRPGAPFRSWKVY
jgi:hypothetical protein